jgi:branched-chain amino acid transport system substrate-binding protein
MKVRGFGVATLAVVVVGGLVAGCSSSSSKPKSSVSPTSSASTTSSASAVAVGVIGDFSGPFASSEGGITTVLSAWASTVNAAGGFNGHNVKVIAKDAGITTGANLTAAKELITSDHVVAIIDTDSMDAAWLPYASAQKIPVVLGYPSIAGVADADAFPVTPSPFAIGYGYMATAKLYGTGAGLAYCAENCAPQAGLFQALAKPAGVSLTVALKASSTAPDYTAVCQAFIDKHVGSYVLGFGGATVTRIADTCYQQGLRAPQIMSGFNSDPTWKTDKAFSGSVAVDGVAPFFDANTAGQKAYRAALTKYAPTIAGHSLDNSWSAFAWASAQLIAVAAKATTGAPTAASLTAGFYTLKDETLGGLVQPLNYTQGKPTALTCYFTWKISGGTLVAGATGDRPTCVSPAILGPIIAAVSKAGG